VVVQQCQFAVDLPAGTCHHHRSDIAPGNCNGVQYLALVSGTDNSAVYTSPLVDDPCNDGSKRPRTDRTHHRRYGRRAGSRHRKRERLARRTQYARIGRHQQDGMYDHWCSTRRARRRPVSQLRRPFTTATALSGAGA